jgi:hypothetical protein
MLNITPDIAEGIYLRAWPRGLRTNLFSTHSKQQRLKSILALKYRDLLRRPDGKHGLSIDSPTSRRWWRPPFPPFNHLPCLCQAMTSSTSEVLPILHRLVFSLLLPSPKSYLYPSISLIRGRSACLRRAGPLCPPWPLHMGREPLPRAIVMLGSPAPPLQKPRASRVL